MPLAARAQTPSPDAGRPPTPAPQPPARTAAPASRQQPGRRRPRRRRLTRSTRSLFAQTWRQVADLAAGSAASTAIRRAFSGIRICATACSSPTRATRARTRGDWLFRVGADNVGWRDQRYFGDYERTGRFVDLGTVGSDSAVLQRRHQHAVHAGARREPAGARRRHAARDPERAGRISTPTCPIATQFDLHERRDIGTVSGHRDADAADRHQGGVHDDAAHGRAAVGRELRLQQRRRGGAALRLAHERLHRRRRVDERAAAWCAWRTTARGSTTSTTRSSGTARCASTTRRARPGRGRMALWPSNSAQTFSVGGYTKLARRTQLTGFMSFGSWSNDEPLQPFTINPTAAAARAAAGHDRRPRPRLLDEPQPGVAAGDRLAVQRPAAPLRLRQRDAAGRHPAVHQLRHVGRRRRRRGGPELYAHSRTTFDADATWTGLLPLALTAGYTHNSGGYDFRIFESTGENVLTLKADAVGSQWVTFRAHYEFADRIGFGPGRGAADADRRAAGAAPLRHRQPHAQSLHRAGGRHAERGRGRSARRSASARTTTTTATSACRSRRSACSRWRPTTSSRTALAWAPATTTSTTRGCSDRGPPVPARRRTR